MRDWTWNCAFNYCDHHGIKPVDRSTAGYNGRRHINQTHHFNVEPTYIKLTDSTINQMESHRNNALDCNHGTCDPKKENKPKINRCPTCQCKLYYRATVMKEVCTNPGCPEYWTGENKPRDV
jgi:hypothetical protein